MKPLITLVFVLSFSWVFGQDSIRKIDIPVLKNPKPKAIVCPPISKVEILPMPPRCQSRYSKLREMGETAKAREFGEDCLKNYLTNLLGDYVMDNKDEIDNILINNCAQSAKGRLKIVIDENGVMSKVEIYGNPRNPVDEQFTKKMEQAMKQVAAQMKDRGELFSQAKTSDGEVVRMFYFIPMTYSPTEDLFPLLAPITPNCAIDSTQSIVTQREECFKNHYKSILEELVKKYLTKKDIEYFKKMETDLAINVKISEIGTILEMGLMYNSNKDLTNTEENEILAIIDKMKQGLQPYESEKFIPAQISCGGNVTYEETVILEYKEL